MFTYITGAKSGNKKQREQRNEELKKITKNDKHSPLMRLAKSKSKEDGEAYQQYEIIITIAGIIT